VATQEPVAQPAVEPSAPQAPAIAKPAVVPAPTVNVVEHPIARHALTALRNRDTLPGQFRVFANQLLLVLAIEATRNLPTRDELVQTVSGSCVGRTMGKPVVLLSLDRHCLGLAHQVADLIPNVAIGTISLERVGNGSGFEPRLHLRNAPAFNTAHVVLFDPVVTTGLSAGMAVDFLHRSGATEITLLSFLISSVALERVQAARSGLTVWTAGVETEVDSRRGAFSSLGNFGERLYG